MYTVKINDGFVEWEYELVDSDGGKYSIYDILNSITNNLVLDVVAERIESHKPANEVGPCEICGSKHHHLNEKGWVVSTEEL